MKRVLLLAALLAAGCGDAGDYPPVSGRVTLDGKPLAGARVLFQPDGAGKLEAGRGSLATTDADGRFALTQIGAKGAAGAKVGRHRVVVSKADREVKADDDKGGGPGGKEVVPAKYSTESTLTFDVPAGGTAGADFALTTK
jgi:hypothetical protein